MTAEERIKEKSEFKKKLQTMSKEALKELEQSLLEQSKELDEKVAKTEFKLPKKDQKECFDNIKYFLNMQKVKWNYALGMITLYEFFDKEQKTVSYALLDTVLRTLGSLDFDGYEQWKKVVNINNYFTPIAEEYRNITDDIYDVAERYSEVDKTLELFEKAATENTSTSENTVSDQPAV